MAWPRSLESEIRASRITRSSSQATCHAISFPWSKKVLSFGIVSASSKKRAEGPEAETVPNTRRSHRPRERSELDP